MSLRRRVGALAYDWPRFEMAVRGLGAFRSMPSPWVAMRNRAEQLSLDGRGARCEWEYGSDLHIARVFPSTGRRLMRRAFQDWPLRFRDTPESAAEPEVTFIIGHRGTAR